MSDLKGSIRETKIEEKKQLGENKASYRMKNRPADFETEYMLADQMRKRDIMGEETDFSEFRNHRYKRLKE